MKAIDIIDHIKNYFSYKIKSSREFHTSQNTQYYEVITTHGMLCLVIEKYERDNNEYGIIQSLKRRYSLINGHRAQLPIVYQQHIINDYPEFIICASITQRFCLLTLNKLKQMRKQQKIGMGKIIKLVKTLRIMEKSNFQMKGKASTNSLMVYPEDCSINVDFTQIQERNTKNKESQKEYIELICDLLSSFDRIKEQICYRGQLILVQQKIYKLNTKVLSSASDFIQLILLLNVSDTFVIETLVLNHTKSTQVNPCKKKWKKIQRNQIDGSLILKIDSKQYTNLTFIDGKCITGLAQINLSQQLPFVCQKNLRLVKQMGMQYTVIEQSEMVSPYELIKIGYPVKAEKKKQKSRQKERKYSTNLNNPKHKILQIGQTVGKIQFINFLIWYLSLLQPVINKIFFNPQFNRLILFYWVNRKQKTYQTVTIHFCQEYIVKDEEISMIMEKCKVQNCILSLNSMKINDTLLIFLANFEKTLNLTEISMSDCFGISENGINILLLSPYSRNIENLSLLVSEPVVQSSVQVLGYRNVLKKLRLQKNSTTKLIWNQQIQKEISFPQLQIQQLTINDLKITLVDLDQKLRNLKILRMTQVLSVDDLKYLAKLSLVQLKIILTQSLKKTIIESTSSFISSVISSKTTPCKTFAEGPSGKTLKILDISNSSIKMKSIKYLLSMPSLDTLSMNDCKNLGLQIEALSPNVTNLYLSNTQLNIWSLKTLFAKIRTLSNLSLVKNRLISKNDVFQFVKERKFYIKNLIMCQSCFLNKLIKANLTNEQNQSQTVDLISVYIKQALKNGDNEEIFSIFMKAMITDTPINILTSLNSTSEEKVTYLVAQKIMSFLHLTSKNETHLRNVQVDSIPIEELVTKYKRINELVQKRQTIGLIRQSANDKIIVPRTCQVNSFLNQLYRFSGETKISLLLQNNRTLPREVMEAIVNICGPRIAQLKIENCLFKPSEINEELFRLEALTSFNDGVIQIELNSMNYQYLQRYLQFCMRLQSIKDLRIHCEDIYQTDLIFSILEHVVDRHSETIESIQLRISSTSLGIEFYKFLNKFECLEKLCRLKISIENTKLSIGRKKENWPKFEQGLNQLMKMVELSIQIQKSERQVWEQFLRLTYKNLESVTISINYNVYIIQFFRCEVTQNQINKLLKSVVGNRTKYLCVDCSKSNFSSATKIFTGSNVYSLMKLCAVQSFVLKFQYCPLKQTTVYQLLQLLQQSRKIKNIYLNLSFSISNIQQLLQRVNRVAIQIGTKIKICLVVVTQSSQKLRQKSRQFIYNKEFCQINGVQLIC